MNSKDNKPADNNGALKGNSSNEGKKPEQKSKGSDEVIVRCGSGKTRVRKAMSDVPADECCSIL